MIPDFQSIMLPLLRFAADGDEHSLANARQELARAMNVSAEEQAELLPSGRQARWANRVAWAKVQPRCGRFGGVTAARHLSDHGARADGPSEPA